MTSCKNCFSIIDNLRKETRCTTCSKPLHKDCAIKDNGTFLCDVCYTVKEEGEIIQRNEIVIPDVIRRSYIELYKSCPYAFYLNVIKGLDVVSNSYAKIGIDLHDLFHRASLGELKTSKELIEAYTPIWNTYEDEMFEQDLSLYKSMTIQELKEKLWKQVIDGVDTFFTIMSKLPKKAFMLEENIVFSIGDNLPQVSITMDRIDEKNGELEMLDWKTGGVIIGQKISSDLQAPLYIYAVRQKYNKPIRKFTFYYLPENKVRVFERITNEDYVCTVNKREYKINLTDAIREVQGIFAQIKKNNFNIPHDVKKMYFTCKMCHFKRKDICKGADMESWKQHNQGGI